MPEATYSPTTPLSSALPGADADPDAELLAACQAFLDADHDLIAFNRSERNADAVILGRYYAALGRLTALQPRTPAGLKAKAKAGPCCTDRAGDG